MNPNEPAADILRSRYRQSRPVKHVRRPVPTVPQTDVTFDRPHAPKPKPTPAVQLPPQPKPEPKPIAVPVLAPKPTPEAPVVPLSFAVPSSKAKHAVKSPAPRTRRKPADISWGLPSRRTVTLITMVVLITAGGYGIHRVIEASESAGNVSVLLPTMPDLASHKVAADMPRYITIPALKSQARVLSSATAPTNEYDGGWSPSSAKPGTDGAAFIVGSISGRVSDGVFYNLAQVTPGMIIQIERGDGTKLRYKVVKTQTYPIGGVDMKAAMTAVTPGKQGLNIMTDTGKFITGTTDYDSRLVVMTERES